MLVSHLECKSSYKDVKNYKKFSRKRSSSFSNKENVEQSGSDESNHKKQKMKNFDAVDKMSKSISSQISEQNIIGSNDQNTAKSNSMQKIKTEKQGSSETKKGPIDKRNKLKSNQEDDQYDKNDKRTSYTKQKGEKKHYTGTDLSLDTEQEADSESQKTGSVRSEKRKSDELKTNRNKEILKGSYETLSDMKTDNEHNTENLKSKTSNSIPSHDENEDKTNSNGMPDQDKETTEQSDANPSDSLNEYYSYEKHTGFGMKHASEETSSKKSRHSGSGTNSKPSSRNRIIEDDFTVDKHSTNEKDDLYSENSVLVPTSVSADYQTSIPSNKPTSKVSSETDNRHTKRKTKSKTPNSEYSFGENEENTERSKEMTSQDEDATEQSDISATEQSDISATEQSDISSSSRLKEYFSSERRASFGKKHALKETSSISLSNSGSETNSKIHKLSRIIEDDSTTDKRSKNERDEYYSDTSSISVNYKTKIKPNSVSSYEENKKITERSKKMTSKYKDVTEKIGIDTPGRLNEYFSADRSSNFGTSSKHSRRSGSGTNSITSNLTRIIEDDSTPDQISNNERDDLYTEDSVFVTTSYSTVYPTSVPFTTSTSMTSSTGSTLFKGAKLSKDEHEEKATETVDTEPGIIIRQRYKGSKKCKERTPPCCVSGQIDINLGELTIIICLYKLFLMLFLSTVNTNIYSNTEFAIILVIMLSECNQLTNNDTDVLKLFDNGFYDHIIWTYTLRNIYVIKHTDKTYVSIPSDHNLHDVTISSNHALHDHKFLR